MKKPWLCLLFLASIFVFNSCEKEENKPNNLQILTDKGSYSVGEEIIIELINNSGSLAQYFVCSSYNGIPPNVYKLENNEWTGYWSPICNGYSSYCCSSIQKGNTYKDTIAISFDKGTYRIEYQLIVQPSQVYKSFFSNTIEVK